MKYIKVIISSLLLLGLIATLSLSLDVGGTSAPPLGPFLNPFSGFWKNADKLKVKDVELKSEQLISTVEIIYDERHVPHIYAQNLSDLMFAQGYAIAKERLWQMDITTRAIEGRTSEVLGERSLSQDIGARRRGLARGALLAEETWMKNPEGVKIINSFVDGVNYYIEKLDPASYPLEFKLLDYEPEPWSVYRTALFVKAMALTLNARHMDIANSNALALFGKEKFNSLYPEKNKKQSPIIQEASWTDEKVTLLEQTEAYIGSIFETEDRIDKNPFVGSNNFAVSGARTKSGNPILANDPHLKLSLPSIWIEMHLVSPEVNAYGVSLPAMPGIILGFNEDIAWGQTNAGHDVLDIYRVKWKDDSKSHYIVDGKEKETEVRIEEFRVNDGDIVKDTVLYTMWGPIRKEKNEHTDLAQFWVSNQAPSKDEILIYPAINQAKNFDEFKQALKGFYTPAQNFIFSSKSGDIGMYLAGRLPKKKDQQGRFIQDGSLSSSKWQGYIPFEELPHELNPSRNYVASANQHSTNDSYPYYYNGGFEDYRGIYINSKLDGLQGAVKEDLMDLQLDAYSLKAEEAVPILLENINAEGLSSKEETALEELRNWDFIYAKKSLGATVFEKWWRAFYEMSFDEIIKERETTNIPFPEAFRLIELMEEEGNSEVFDKFDTEKVESMKDIVNASFKSVRFDSIEIKPWTESRNTEINHLSNISAFSTIGIQSAGHGNTPNAISKYNGPSWRMVVEMDDPIKAYGIYPGGQSGNPGSEHYDNFIKDWAEGNYYELNYSRDPVKIKVANKIKIARK